MRTFAIKGHICQTDASRQLQLQPDGYLVCINGRSRGVFPVLPEEYRLLPLLDFGDRIILPGMVDLHMHAPQFTYRGFGMDMELLEWLEKNAFPEEVRYQQEEYAIRAYEIFSERLRRSATTRACIFATIHVPATMLLMQLLEKTGLKAMVGKVNMDRNSPDILREASAEDSAAATERWIEQTLGKFRNVRPILTPRFVPSCSDALLEQLGQLQRRYGLAVQSHLSENLSEIEWVHTLCPGAAFYGDAYDRFGLFGSGGPTVMAHCVHSTQAECERMKERGVWIAHCPDSNTNIASGIAPVRKYLEQGQRVGLGSDVAGGQTEHLFRAMVQAIQVSKLYWRLVDQTQAPLTLGDALYMATRGGGAFFGKVGAFDEGYEVDALVMDETLLPSPRPLPLRQRLERMIYLGDQRHIHAKFVAGERIF